MKPFKTFFTLLFTFLFAFAAVFANQYGPSTLILEKTWTIYGQTGTHITLDGIFIVNNSNQKVVSIEKTDGAELAYEKNGIIKISYDGKLDSEKKEITAKAVVDVFYSVDIPGDSPFKINPIEPGNYTGYDVEMEQLALELADTQTIYGTIRNLTDWTYKYITYDLDYFGKNSPAKTVFVERRGVCVEYSHLLISMMNALGLKTRYVSGYVYGREWQPHAWVEVEIPGDGILPLDPTFNEAQVLDNTHIAMYYSKDQADVFDRVSSDKKITFESNESVTQLTTEKANKKTAELTYDFNETTETIKIGVKNTLGKNVFLSYGISIPKDVGTGERTLILLKPFETKEFAYKLNSDYAKEGFVYNIPVLVYLNDMELNENIVIAKKITGEEKNGNGTGGTGTTCPFVTAIILLALIGAIKRG